MPNVCSTRQKNISLMTDRKISCDALLGGMVKLQQPLDGYRSAIDAVFLAAAMDTRFGASIAEFGTGAGASSLCLALRTPEAEITGFDADQFLCDLAVRNAGLNGVSDRLHIEQRDVTLSADLPEGAFDQVMTNPPFYLAGAGTKSSEPSREKSLRLDTDGLARWVRSIAKVLRHHGRATFIYSVERLELLIGELDTRFGGLRLFPLWQRAGLPAKRILVQARKGSRTPTALLPGMVLHLPNGQFTAEAEAVLRRGATIDLGTG